MYREYRRSTQPYMRVCACAHVWSFRKEVVHPVLIFFLSSSSLENQPTTGRIRRTGRKPLRVLMPPRCALISRLSWSFHCGVRYRVISATRYFPGPASPHQRADQPCSRFNSASNADSASERVLNEPRPNLCSSTPSSFSSNDTGSSVPVEL